MTFGSLFSGIGGLDLGLERAGMTCEWQVEIDSYARRVLAKHWPRVKRWDDVRTFPPDNRWEHVDIVCGGFPCQDISSAGPRIGLGGERSSLWWEFHRIVGLVRPKYVLVENVADLRHRGLGDVLGSLSNLGYDAEWSVISACAMGAPHMRKRLFILANSNSKHGEKRLGLWNWQTTQERHISENKEYWMDAVSRAMRSHHGVSNRMDRIRTIGNSVVPQVAEWIGRMILEAHARGEHP